MLLGFAASAQEKSGTSFSLRVGGGFQNFNGKNQNGDKLEMSLVPAYNAGVIVDMPLALGFALQTGLLYTTKGADAKNNFLGLNMATRYKLAYIELPVNFMYKPGLGNGNLLLGAGPYVAYGVGGNVQYEIGNNSSEEKVSYTKEHSSVNPMDQKYFKPLDYGGNLLFGYQFPSGFSAQLNAQLGFAQIRSDNTTQPNSEVEVRNTGFGLSVGYAF